MKNTIIFDMDGIIFDTEQVVLESYRYVAPQFNLHNIEDVMHQCIGLNNTAAKLVFETYYGPSFDYNVMKPIASQ